MPAPVYAFSPGHISGYFKMVPGDSVITTGSIGAGVVISEGVTASAEPSGTTIITVERVDRSGRCISRSSGSTPLEYAIRELGVTARITTSCRLPIGAGFGMSAAALLASLTAANELLGLGISRREIALRAHESEVVHRTGLGDVAACQGGGFVIRKEPGIDGEITRIFPRDCELSAISFGPISTPVILGSGEAMARVASAYPDGYPASVPDIFRFSRRFAESSGLIYGETRAVLDACAAAHVPASMTMLGKGVFAGGSRAQEILGRFGDIYSFAVAGEGVHLLEGRK